MFGIDKDFQNLMEQLYGPLNKDKEPPDTIEIAGVKYKRVEDTQPFYDKLWGLLKTKLGDSVDCDEMTDRVRDLIREHIPKPVKINFMSEYLLGYNEAIRQVKLRLFNGIQ
jgi:hypothetical protein